MENIAIINAIQQRIDTRSIQILIGICSGIIADKQIHEKELAYLHTWLLEHQDIIKHWPASAIYQRINRITSDGIITQDELDDMMQLLTQITGNHFSETGAAYAEGPALPVEDDPSIFFKDMLYCFTGEFLYGSRAACERVVLQLGAMPVDNVTLKTDYLVIGSKASDSWINETFGRKIKRAVELRETQKSEICIISEQQWFRALSDTLRF